MVINGPVAMAGSILNFSKVIGTIVPKIEANMTTEKRDKDTAMVTASIPIRNQLYPNTRREIMLALIKATANSFSICFPALCNANDPFARPCTTIAEDCIPTFPPVPPIRGIKRAIAGFVINPVSKFPRIIELVSPPNIPINSHGSRAEVCV